MKLEISKEWFERMVDGAEGMDIEAGAPLLEPFYDFIDTENPSSIRSVRLDDGNVKTETNTPFGQLLQYMRRDKGMSVEDLARDADLDVEEIIEIEDTKVIPTPRTVHQLATYFKVSKPNLLQVAGLTEPRNEHILAETQRFAARSKPIVGLTSEERLALEAFVSVLAEDR